MTMEERGLPAWSSVGWVLAALAPIIGGAVGALEALVLVAATVVVMIVVGAIVLAVRPLVGIWGALAVSAFVAVALATIFSLYLDVNAPELAAALGVFVPLIAVNPLVLRQALLVELDAPGSLYARSLAAAVELVILAVAIGVVREIFADGTIFGAAIGDVGADAFGAPAFALFFAGLLVAAFRAVRKEGEPKGGETA